MKVLVTHSNSVLADEKQRQKMQPYPPLQTLLAVSVLREEGCDVELCDVTLENAKELLAEAIGRMAPCLVLVCEDDFNFITKMCLLQNRHLAFWTARTAKAHGCTAAVHGSDSSDQAAEYINAGFDYVLIGEIEDTLREFAACRRPAHIAGLALRDERTGAIQYTAPRRSRINLGALPRPCWDAVNMQQYREAWMGHHGFFSLNLVSSRGCPYRCNWCAKPIYGNSYRVRPAGAVAEEMLFLKGHYAPDHIWFADDIFALSGQWTKEFALAVERWDAAIPFKMQSRCDLMTRSTVDYLRRAGCVEVWMGAESGSQRILDAMDKGTNLHHVFEAAANLRAHGIRVAWFLQFGYPGETWDDIEQTIEMVRATKPDDIGISVSYPLPGTKFHQIVSAELGEKSHWSHSGDLTMMFRGAYSSQLYRALAHAIHMEVRTPSEIQGIKSAWHAVDVLRATDGVHTEAAAS